MINEHQRKRQFLHWLLTHYQHANPEVNMFLQFLMTEPNCTRYIVFSENVAYAPRGIFISYLRETSTPFVYYKNQRQYTKCEQAFHDFRLNATFSEEKFYIEIDVPNIYLVLYEFAIFEENPYLPIDKHLIEQQEQWLEHLTLQAQMHFWKEKIDEGLSRQNYEQVEYYLQLIERSKED